MKTSWLSFKNKGFTLIELLVVIAIIALLTGIILTNLVGSKAKSRDAKRASDVAQIQLAIEQYFDRCNQYPTSDNGKIDSSSLNDGTSGNVCPSGVTFGSFISQIPSDPNGGSYDYVTNHDVDPTDNPYPTDYVLHAKFETSNTAAAQSAPVPSWWTSSTYFPSNPSVKGSAACDTQYNYCVRPN